MRSIQNPILTGFFPDPSICRVGDDYYIANSSFEWFPGVPIHHSKDLVNWRLIGHALTRKSQLDLRGVPDSAGVWAPSLSHADGQFWLVYTNLRNTGMGRPFKDLEIFLATAPDISGPWSEPVELNSVGFDPSLFHDDDGRKWLVNILWDFRKGRSRFAGIVIQEYGHRRHRLIGPMTKILEKDGILTEGPNLYKHNGWYYLMLAEGGTGWNHGISMARSRSILGPYELDPQTSVLTSRDDPSLPLQKAGHGEIVETPAGEWYLAHLASRPLKTDAPANAASPDKSPSAAAHAGDRCLLGRETCLQRVEWRDGWLRLASGGTSPQTQWPAPKGLPPHPWPVFSPSDHCKPGASQSSLRGNDSPSPAGARPSPAGAGEGARRADEGLGEENHLCGEGRGEGARASRFHHPLGVHEAAATSPPIHQSTNQLIQSSSARDDFNSSELGPEWCTLRTPADESWLSLTERPGWLRLRGRDSLHSFFDQSLVARRVQHFKFTAEACLEFSPENFMQSAGLICYYDTRTHFYLRVTHDEQRGKVLRIVLTDDGAYDELADGEIVVNEWKQFHLRVEVDSRRLQFSASPDGQSWQPVGPVLDSSKLSDDYGTGLHFTGAMVGLCAQDVGGNKVPADFDCFIYRGIV